MAAPVANAFRIRHYALVQWNRQPDQELTMFRRSVAWRHDVLVWRLVQSWVFIEARWASSSGSRRTKVGPVRLGQLTSGIRRLEERKRTANGSKLVDLLQQQVMLGSVAARIALDLGQSQNAMDLAREFRDRFELALSIAQQDEFDAEVWGGLSKAVVERYNEVRAAWLSVDLAVGARRKPI
jgi:hypothetical protein